MKPGAQEPRRSSYLVPARDIISTAPRVFDQRRLPSFPFPLPTIVKHVPWEFSIDDGKPAMATLAGGGPAPIEQVTTALSKASFKPDFKRDNLDNNNNNPDINYPSISISNSNDSKRAYGENSGSANQNSDPLPRGYAYLDSDQAMRGTLGLLHDMMNAP